MYTAIVLAGGRSCRIGGDKGLTLLNGRPLVAHVLARLESVVDELIIVVSSDVQVEAYRGFGARVLTDRVRRDTPLVGAYTGLAEAKGEYAFLTGVDQPLLDPRVIRLLFNEAEGHDAATPTWPNGWVEPLHAVYRSEPAATTALSLIECGEKKLSRILSNLSDVRHIPIDEIKALDQELLTLIDVDTSEELARVSRLLIKY